MEAEREPRSIERNVGMAGTLVPSQPEPPLDYLPYHYDQQKYRAAAAAAPRSPEYYVDARDLVARDLVALESQIAEDVLGYNEPQYDTTSYVYGDGGGADFTQPYHYPYESDQVGYAPSSIGGGGGFLQVNHEDDEVCMRLCGTNLLTRECRIISRAAPSFSLRGCMNPAYFLPLVDRAIFTCMIAKQLKGNEAQLLK